MSKLSSYFSIGTAITLTLYSIFLIARLFVGGTYMSINEIQILCLLMIVNAVNSLHFPSTK